jgi:hypothetical protein
MKVILRWRWVLIAILLFVLYFIGRGFKDPEVWLYVLLMFIVGWFGERLTRIEEKLDAISKRSAPAD